MARKTCFEIMDELCDKVFSNNGIPQFKADESYFVNMKQIHNVKETTRSSERLFYVTEDGALVKRTDEFK